MKYLYKYPQAAFPYDDLVETNKRRNRREMEYELLDTGVFDERSLLRCVRGICQAGYRRHSDPDHRVQSRAGYGHAACTAHSVVSQHVDAGGRGTPKPVMKADRRAERSRSYRSLPRRAGRPVSVLRRRRPVAVHGERNQQRADLRQRPTPARTLKTGSTTTSSMGMTDAVNPEKTGTKAAAHYQLNVGAGKTATIRLRLTDVAPAAMRRPVQELRCDHADAPEGGRRILQAVTPDSVSEDEARVMRQALAGMLWTKQYFFFDVDKWLEEHGVDPLRPSGRFIRNSRMVPHGERSHHLDARQVGVSRGTRRGTWRSTPSLSPRSTSISPRNSSTLMLQEFFLHPTGQIPAYEWNFSDVNPPVHAWATIFLYRTEQAFTGRRH